MIDMSGPDFVTLLVSDLDASYRFYKETIGWPESDEKYPNARAFSTQPCALGIRQSPDRRKPSKPGEGIILWVRSSNAAALYAELRQRGVPIVDELRQGPWGGMFSFKDPDGYVLTVHDAG